MTLIRNSWNALNILLSTGRQWRKTVAWRCNPPYGDRCHSSRMPGNWWIPYRTAPRAGRRADSGHGKRDRISGGRLSRDPMPQTKSSYPAGWNFRWKARQQPLGRTDLKKKSRCRLTSWRADESGIESRAHQPLACRQLLRWLLHPHRSGFKTAWNDHFLFPRRSGRMRAVAHQSCQRKYEFGQWQKFAHQSCIPVPALHRISKKPECN